MSFPQQRELWIGKAGIATSAQRTDALSAAGTLSVDIALDDQSLFAANGMQVPDEPRASLVQWLSPDAPGIRTAPIGWLVRSRLGFAHDHPRSPGEPTPGVKQVSFVKKRDDMTSEEFDQRYRQHIEVTRQHHAGVWQYAQSLVERPLSADAPPIHGISELWFKSAEDFAERFYTGPDSPDAVREDTTGFIDFAGTFSVLVTETQVAP